MKRRTSVDTTAKPCPEISDELFDKLHVRAKDGSRIYFRNMHEGYWPMTETSNRKEAIDHKVPGDGYVNNKIIKVRPRISSPLLLV